MGSFVDEISPSFLADSTVLSFLQLLSSSLMQSTFSVDQKLDEWAPYSLQQFLGKAGQLCKEQLRLKLHEALP